jgi:hypothetical protein
VQTPGLSLYVVLFGVQFLHLHFAELDPTRRLSGEQETYNTLHAIHLAIGDTDQTLIWFYDSVDPMEHRLK